MLVLPMLLWLGYKEIKSQLEQPQAILVLGGSTQREKFAAEFARQYPDLPIWISGGSPKEYAQKLFAKAGIDSSRLHLDYRAVDTVTNFTTLVDQFQARGIKKIYLITSDYHMRRARIIGEIVLGSRGIEFQPISVPSESSPEPIKKAIRDGARAVFWVATGYTGSTLTK
ncbi:YdcF family protein [Chroococcidiopsis sp. CCMEE 29]|uniref:YdcF family protein n=1 Tax=Chroococcidiopsis sp. CCMEE 29 TaxID=155894 RepID=UPI0031F8FCF0